jgi:hypothetical protein
MPFAHRQRLGGERFHTLPGGAAGHRVKCRDVLLKPTRIYQQPNIG